MVRHPWYVLLASLTIGTTVAVPLALFMVLNAIWLKPMPFQDAERLVVVIGGAFASLQAPALQAFEAVAGQVVTADQASGLKAAVRLTTSGRDLEVTAVTPGFFTLLGVKVQGREFTAADEDRAAEKVAILSHELWTNVFGSDPRVIGTWITSEPAALRVVGIAPAGFRGARRGERTDLWIPSRRSAEFASLPAASNVIPLMAFGRLRPQQTVVDAEREIRRATGALSELRLETLDRVFGTPSTRSVPLGTGGSSPLVFILAGLSLMCGCVTLIAVVVAHFDSRSRDFAIRVALGASKRHLMMQVAAQTLVLLVLGVGIAVVFSYWILSALPALTLPGGLLLNRLDTRPDWRVFSVAVVGAAIPLAVATVYGFRRLMGGGVALLGRRETDRGSHRVRLTLLCGQVLLTTSVVVTAALFVSAVRQAVDHASGIDANRTAFATVTLAARLTDSVAMSDWLKTTPVRWVEARTQLEALPEVESVAFGPALLGVEAQQRLEAPSRIQTSAAAFELPVGVLSGSADYARALGIRPLVGRGLEASDGAMSPAPALVTERLAKTLWPNESPLGQALTVGPRSARMVVVGVMPEFVFGSMTRPADGAIVTVDGRAYGGENQFVVRMRSTDGQEAALAAALRTALPEASRIDVRLGSQLVLDDIGEQRAGAWLFSGFGIAALLLGVAGVFGFVYYLTASRWHELAIRAALGATPRSLQRLVVGGALRPVALAVAAGLLLAELGSRLIRAELVGMEGTTVTVHVAVAALMLLATSAAGFGAVMWLFRGSTPLGAETR